MTPVKKETEKVEYYFEFPPRNIAKILTERKLAHEKAKKGEFCTIILGKQIEMHLLGILKKENFRRNFNIERERGIRNFYQSISQNGQVNPS